MNRTKYWLRTRPADTQLNNTEDTKVDAILVRQRATTQLGTVIGFQVTPNSVDATLIDIGPGEGYTGGMYTQLNVKGTYSAERIASDSNIITGQALADYTAGVRNYVSIVYTETTDTPLDEIYYPFVAHDSLIHEAYTVSVLTEANWNLLTVAEKRLRILVAIVTAGGAGIPIPTASIQQLVQPKNLPIATQPSNITGLTVNNVSDITPIGTGTLRWEVSTSKLYWTAPGDTEGVGVVLSTSGSYTIHSGTTTYYIVVYAVSASLPLANATDTIYIQSMYGATFPRYSAVDSVHREMIGHGVPSIFNPHGLNDTDITGLGFDHAALFHVNGISVQADTAQLACRIDPDPTVDQVLVRNLGGRLNSFLIAGSTYTDINGISSGTEAIVSFDTSPPATGEYMIYLDDAANLQKLLLGSSLWSANIYLIDMKNTTAGAGAVITWDATAKTLTYAAPGDAAGAAVYLMGYDSLVGYYGYYKLYSSDTANWVIVYVGGALGGNNSTTFTTAKSETTNADNSILKLCVVHWDLPSETLSNIRDIRQWGSTDWRDRILEEHDENGHHNKVFQNPIRAIAQTGPAISAYAVVGAALALGAPNSAVIGNADTQAGLVGIASVAGVIGTASVSVGVLGSAPLTAVEGLAATSVGVLGTAPNYGGVFMAATNYGVSATAAAAVAGTFAAPNSALMANAATAAAAIFSAPNSALIAQAATATAGYASAPNNAFYVIAATNDALVASAIGVRAVNAAAPNTAMYAVAATTVAGYVSAPNSAFYVIAGTNDALFATVPGVRAINAAAPNTAMYAVAATKVGLYVSAPTSAIIGTATAGYAIGGSVSGDSGLGVGGYATGATAVGIAGAAEGDTCMAVQAYASGTAGMAIYAVATGQDCQGLNVLADDANGVGITVSGGSLGIGCKGHDIGANISGAVCLAMYGSEIVPGTVTAVSRYIKIYWDNTLVGIPCYV